MLTFLNDWLAGRSTDSLHEPHWVFNAPFTVPVYVLLFLGTLALFLFYYLPKLNIRSKSMRVFLLTLRVLFILLIFLLLLDPCIEGELIKPGEQYVVLLFDDSKSMQVYGERGQSRGNRLVNTYQGSFSSFDEKLRNKYQVARYRFGDSIEPIPDVNSLTFSQTKTDLVGAIQEVKQEFSDVTLAGIVLFSDGNQQTPEEGIAIQALQENDVPVFSVGVGEDSAWRDLRIRRLNAQRTHFDQSPVVLNVELEAIGFAGEQIQVDVMENGLAVQSEQCSITDPVQNTNVRIQFVPQKKEWVEYEVQAHLADDKTLVPGSDPKTIPENERVKENNSRSFLVDNTEKVYRVLYYSGRPNWEHKFIRRALEDEKQMKVASLILMSRGNRQFVYRGARTGMTNPLFDGFENDQEKYGRYDEPIYLRIGVNESELVKGYPDEAEELFSYHVIILGGLNPEDFSERQLELTREFVDRRGGALLVFGGERAFEKGSYAGSVFESMLPVMLEEKDTRMDTFILQDFFRISPTTEGEIVGTWSLSNDAIENRRLWSQMPELFGLNEFAFTRAGATIWAKTRSPVEELDERPFFVVQRYGNGKCAVLATPETWPWQMETDVANPAHERIWRQIVRSLVADVPKPILFRNKKDDYTAGESASFEFLIRDKLFQEREGINLEVKVKTPSEREVSLNMDESIEEMGIYKTKWQPDEAGVYSLTITATDRDGQSVGEYEESFLVTPDQNEFERVQYNPQYLKEMADKTGGSFFSLEQLEEVPGQIPWTPGEEMETVQLHVWHNPIFFIILILMMTLDWYLRRKRGMP